MMYSFFPTLPLKRLMRPVSAGAVKIKGHLNDLADNDGFPGYSASGQDIRLPDYQFDTEGLVLSSVGAQCGKCFHATGKWGVVANTQPFMVTEKGHPRYLYYLVNQQDFWEKGGTAQPYVQIPASISKAVPVPPLNTQRRIAQFLDEKTARIDALIEKKHELLDRLAEKRQALITRAVTKGLDSDVPMKPSGVEWIGEIPRHWGIVRLRWYLRTASGEGLRNVNIADERTEIDYATVIGGNGTMGFTDATNSEKAILVIGRVGAHCGNVHPIDEPSWITDNALRVYDVRSFDRHYLLFTLRTCDLNRLASRNAQPLMTGETVKAQYLPCPPISEQQAIGKELEQSMSSLEDTTDRINQSIQVLFEYRSAVISAAVTGQITELI